MHLTPLQRFQRKYRVHEKSGCWNWTGCRDGDRRAGRGRYGRFALDGYHMMAAHRAGYILHRGAIPDGLELLHRCDNTLCVNPDHLRPGTTQDNSDDKISKGRAWHQQNDGRSPRFGTGVGRVIPGKGCVVDTACAICGAAMVQRITASRTGRVPVCSPACKSALNSKRQSSKIQTTCAECGRVVFRVLSELLGNKRTFCSRRCCGKHSARDRWQRNEP